MLLLDVHIKITRRSEYRDVDSPARDGKAADIYCAPTPSTHTRYVAEKSTSKELSVASLHYMQSMKTTAARGKIGGLNWAGCPT